MVINCRSEGNNGDGNNNTNKPLAAGVKPDKTTDGNGCSFANIKSFEAKTGKQQI